MKNQLKKAWRKIRFSLDKQRLNLVKLFWDKAPNFGFNAAQFDAQQIKKIAILRWDNKLGDTIMSTIFIDQLLRYRPDIEITIFAPEYLLNYYDFAPNVVKIISPKPELKSAKLFKKYSEQFDLVVELASEIKPNTYIALSCFSAKHYLGYNQTGFKLFDINIAAENIHFSERYYQAAQMLITNAADKNQKLAIRYPDFNSQRQQLVSFFANNATEKHVENNIAINLFGASKYRSFSFDNAKILLTKWRNSYPNDRLILIKAPQKEDFLARLIVELNDSLLCISPLSTGLAETFALIDFCDFTFTPDTAVVHMSGAINKPVLAVYNIENDEINYQSWQPLATNSQSIFTQINAGQYRRYIHQFNWDDFAQARKQLLNKTAIS